MAVQRNGELEKENVCITVVHRLNVLMPHIVLSSTLVLMMIAMAD